MATAATPILDGLLSDRLINQEQHDLACQRLYALSSEPFPNAGEALIWLRMEDILSDEDLEEIEALSVSQAGFAGNAARVEALQQMHAAVQREAEAYNKELLKQSDKAMLDAMFPGPRWLWLCGGAVLAVAAAWYVLAPDATPGCDDARVQQAFRSAAFMQSTKDAFRSAESASVNYLSAQFSDVKEVGYLKEERSRGCTATVKIGDMAVPMGYSVSPTGKSGEMLVKGEDPRVLRARYRQIDEKLGQPAGASRLRTAFTNGVDDFTKQTRPLQQDAFDAARKRKREMRGEPPETDTRTVRNVQPLNNCEALGNGKWSCRVQAEYRDIVLSALGQSEWQVMEGDFDFVQDGETWRVSDGFARQYVNATVRARVALLKGDEVAERLEEIQSEKDKQARPAAPQEESSPASEPDH